MFFLRGLLGLYPPQTCNRYGCVLWTSIHTLYMPQVHKGPQQMQPPRGQTYSGSPHILPELCLLSMYTYISMSTFAFNIHHIYMHIHMYTLDSRIEILTLTGPSEPRPWQGEHLSLGLGVASHSSSSRSPVWDPTSKLPSGRQ